LNQASIFTLEKKGNAYKDFSEFPQDIYVDTSAWITAYDSNSSYNPVREFMGDCLDNGTTLYHSEMVLSEIVHVNEKAFYDKYANEYKSKAIMNGQVNQKKLKKLINSAHPEIRQNIMDSQKNFLHIIQTSSIMLEYESNEDYFEEILRIRESTDYILGVNDAKHVFIARQYGINSFLTADGDFIALDNDNIYAPQNEKYTREKIGRNNILLNFDPNQY